MLVGDSTNKDLAKKKRRTKFRIGVREGVDGLLT